MRILHVIHDYFPAVGGSEVLFQHLAEGMSGRGHDVRVFTSTALRTGDFIRPDGAGLPAGPDMVNGVSVHRFRYRQARAPVRKAFNIIATRWCAGRWPGYGSVKVAWIGPHLPGLVGEAVRFGPDLVLGATSPFQTIYLAERAARRSNAPVAIMPCLHPGDAWVLDNPALLALLKRADAVLTLTEYESLLLRSLGVAARRIYVLGGGVVESVPHGAPSDLRERFGIEPGSPIVLFLGRKEAGKGVQEVVDALMECWQAGVRATLVLAGAATEYSRAVLEPYLRTLPPEWRGRIVSRDDIDEKEKWGWYQACSLLAHPSRIESFGLVYLEAWSCGKPVIGGRTGPQASLVKHDEDGLLVGCGDRHELAAAVRRLVEDPELRRRLGANGQRKVRERFTWPAIVERASQIYDEIVHRYRAASR